MIDKIANLTLIENCLLHLQFELSRKKPSYFRIAREAHLTVYRTMIEVIKGTANLAITGKRSKIRTCIYKRDGKTWQEVHKVPVDGCKKAWRFSQPKPCEEIEKGFKPSRDRKEKDFLMGFYDALSMIQTELFINQFVHSKITTVSDYDMKIFEWLHEEIRNKYEHFVPKIYLSPIIDLLNASELCIHLSKNLLLESGNVIFFNVSQNQFERLFLNILNSLEKMESYLAEPKACATNSLFLLKADSDC
jgi:hypothetical protein